MTQIGKVAADVSSRIALPWLPKHSGCSVGLLNVACSRPEPTEAPVRSDNICDARAAVASSRRFCWQDAGVPIPKFGAAPNNSEPQPVSLLLLCSIFACWEIVVLQLPTSIVVP